MPKMLRSWANTRDNITDFAENGDIYTMYSRYDTYEFVRTYLYIFSRCIPARAKPARVLYVRVRIHTLFHLFKCFYCYPRTDIPFLRSLCLFNGRYPHAVAYTKGGRRGYRTVEKRADRSIDYLFTEAQYGFLFIT